MEIASRRGRGTQTPLKEIPAFRQHLARTGKTLAQFEAEQPRPDLTSESLNLARRKLSLNQGKAK